MRGTAIFLPYAFNGIPSALLHNLKHNQVLHERVLILTVKIEEVPQVPDSDRLEVHDADHGFYHVVLHYGFMEEVDVPRNLSLLESCGGGFQMMSTSFFLGRQKLVPSDDDPEMAIWRERLFAWMMKSSESAMESFRLPTNRVVELGSQLRI